MQVISRVVDEGLVIGDDVIVKVLEVQDDCVRLAISDPNGSPRYREQTLYTASKEELQATS